MWRVLARHKILANLKGRFVDFGEQVGLKLCLTTTRTNYVAIHVGTVSTDDFGPNVLCDVFTRLVYVREETQYYTSRHCAS